MHPSLKLLLCLSVKWKIPYLIFGPSVSNIDIDGAFFGTTFSHLFLMTYGNLKPQKQPQRYIPRIFGYKVHKQWRIWGSMLVSFYLLYWNSSFFFSFCFYDFGSRSWEIHYSLVNNLDLACHWSVCVFVCISLHFSLLKCESSFWLVIL